MTATSAPRKVIYRPLAKLVGAEENPRVHDLDELAASIARFGIIDLVVEDGRTGRLIAGHGRTETLRAAELAGLEPPDGIRIVAGRWHAPVIVGWSSADDTEADAALVAVNHTGTWDDAALARLLQGMDDLAGTGFTVDDIADMLNNDPGPAGDELTDRDAVPDLPATPITSLGDVWQLGPHRLLCGDATKADSYTTLFAGATAAAVITDPPYNVDYVGGTDEHLTILNDAMPIDIFDTFLRDAFAAMSTPLDAGGAVYVFHADGNGNAFRNAYTGSGLLLKQILVWVKDRFVLGRQDYNWQHEPIIYGWKPGAAHRWFGGYSGSTIVADDDASFLAKSKVELVDILEDMRRTSTIMREPRRRRNDDHPTIKPVDLLARLLVNSTRPGDIVLDPFAGSGSTMIAAHATSRTCYALELDPKYCDVIVRRWEEHTGVAATRAGGKVVKRKRTR